MAERPVSTSRAMAAWAGLAALAAGLCLREVLADLEQARSADSAATAAVEWAILVYGTLPRAVVALIAGATLGLSGLLLQRILRNPLAEPSTLGIAAGAQLTLAVAALQGQALAGLSRQAVAFAGGVAAVTCVLALTWRRGLEPVAVVLAGMMVSLTCTAAAAALILANGEYMFSLFIWGGGALAQENWGPAASLAVQLGIGFSVALLLVKPLAVLGLDEAGARSLGVALHTTRLAIVALAVWMASSVTAAVGIIGFVGLAAPALATLSGLHSVRTRLVGAPLIGAVLLWLADGLVQLAAAGGGERVPTGAATALLGGPLLLWMLPRLKMIEWPNLAASRATVVRRLANPWAAVAILAAAVPTVALAALVLGRGPDGWAIAFTELLPWRGPRVAVAGAAGAMLAAAGVIAQRLTANPLASPEVLGIGSGAGAGLTLVLLAAPTSGLLAQFAGLAAGALAALAIVLGVSARHGLGPERMLLAGTAVGALCSAVATAVIATGNCAAFTLLGWLSGSTNAAGLIEAWLAVVGAVVLVTPLFFLTRWLDVMPLGGPGARSLGVPFAQARSVLVLAAGLLTAASALFIGPLSFVGLIAPHLARLLGLTRAGAQLAGSAALGAVLMIGADWLARMAAFPYQLPVGLLAALLGGPYLVFLLAKGSPRHG